MRFVTWLRDAIAELISLIADDPVLVVGAFVGLAVTWALGRSSGAPHSLTGPVLFLLVWATIAASLWRFVRQRSR
jgi:predicted NBD/HSP70 family sugar kinase